MGDPERTDAKAEFEIADAIAKTKVDLASLLAEPADKQKQRREIAEEAKKAEEQKKRSEAPKPAIVPFVKPSPKRAVEPAVFDEKDLTRVPGIVGRLTDWITTASLYPNRRLSLGASLTTFATVIGQRVAGPTHGSTHVYVALLAPTAGGKQQPIDCGKEALREAGAVDRIGSGDFRSSVALVNSLRVQSVFCSFIDEYGLVLQRLCGKGAERLSF